MKEASTIIDSTYIRTYAGVDAERLGLPLQLVLERLDFAPKLASSLRSTSETESHMALPRWFDRFIRSSRLQPRGRLMSLSIHSSKITGRFLTRIGPEKSGSVGFGLSSSVDGLAPLRLLIVPEPIKIRPNKGLAGGDHPRNLTCRRTVWCNKNSTPLA
jgi:hypothetical protein